MRRSTHKRARRWPGLFLSPVDKVRREYAIYLDHCQRHGVTILRGDTSLEMCIRDRSDVVPKDAYVRDALTREQQEKYLQFVQDRCV